MKTFKGMAIVGWLLLGLFFVFETKAQSLKKPIKYYYEGNIAKAKDYIFKELPAHPFDPGLNFVLAACYLKNPAGKSLDSALTFNKIALNNYNAAGDKRILALLEYSISSDTLNKQNRVIDSLYYKKLSGTEGTKGLLDYLELFPIGVFKEVAEDKIYGLDYQKATKLNSIEGYKAFLTKHPNAPQALKTRNLIDSLVFAKETASGNLETLEKFALENPNHPKRNLVIEKIYHFKLGLGTSKALASFGLQFPEHPLNFEAWTMALALWPSDMELFFAEYPLAKPREVLRAYFQALIPIPDTNKINYVDRLGTLRTSIAIDTSETIPCAIVSGPVLNKIKKKQWVLKDGKVLRTSKSSKIIQPEGYALNAFLLEPSNAKGDGPFEVYNIFGRKVLPAKYNIVSTISTGIVAGNTTVGLYAFNGEVLLTDTFLSIQQQGNVIEAEGKDTIYNLSGNTLLSLAPQLKSFKNLSEIAINPVKINLSGAVDSVTTDSLTFKSQNSPYKNHGIWYWTKSKKGLQIWKGPIKPVSPMIVQAVSITKEGNIAIMNNNKFGLLTASGDQLPAKFSAIPIPYPEKQGFYITQEGGLYGLSNESGKLVIPHVFNNIRPWNSRNAIVESDSGNMFLSLTTYRPTGSVFKNFRILKTAEGISVIVFSIQGKFTAISSRSGTIIPAAHSGMEIYPTDLGTLIRTDDELGSDKMLLSFYNIRGQLMFSKEVPLSAYERMECE
jgi:hypothetical protein